MQSHIKIKKTSSLTIIQLDRPKALNALGLTLLTELKSALIDAFADPEVKTIWLESTQEKAFCAGGDVKSLALEVDKVSLPLEKSAVGRKYFALEYAVDLLIEESVKPIVMYSEGITFGGGWGLFAGGNLKLCSANARFCMPENQIGFFPDVGATSFLQHNHWKTGTFLGLSGIPITAVEAMALDYVDDIIERDHATLLQQQLARGIEITELDIQSDNTEIKGIFDLWQEAIALLPDDGALTDWMSIIEQSSFEPFARAKHAWQTASSWSVAFTWNYFRKMRQTARAKALKEETDIGAYFCAHPEFYEGVHAKLIEKTGSPKWLYPHVESVPLNEILKAID
jgi:enoyl-CoA hydratase